MGRPPRIHEPEYVYHIINRANARLTLFETDADYHQFIDILLEARVRVGMHILAYCIMPNHWHLALYPQAEGDLPLFMQWLTLTHTQRYHVSHKTRGYGHLYQGRYKSFIVQEDAYCQRLMVYIEQNPLRAKLVDKAQDWHWGSLYHRYNHTKLVQELLSPWPFQKPEDYLTVVNTLPEEEECEDIRISVNRGQPYGSPNWKEKIIKLFNLQSTIRRQGRPKNGT